MRPTAVLVDDEESITEVFKDVLEVIGIDVVGVGYNGKDAEELYKKYNPDVVFTDIMMPETDGFYAIKKIREINPEAKIIAVTADLSNETTQKLQEIEISALIHKPFDIQHIKKLLIEKFGFQI